MIKKIICLGVILIMVIAMMIAMTACEPKNEGKFYSLREAYERGFLTQEHLESLVFYYNGGSDDESFVPIPKNPEVLSTEQENMIKRTHLMDIVKKDYPNAKVSGVHIVDYYGIYNDCVAVHVRDDYRVIDILVEPEYFVGEVLFRDFTFPGLIIWREIKKL